NLSWRIGLTLSGPRPGRFAAPAHVIVRLNGATLAEFDARSLEQDYEWDIRPWQLGLNGDVLLEIESGTFQTSPGGPELGIRVTRVWLTRAAGIALPSGRGFLLTLVLVGCCAAILRMAANAGLMSIQPTRLADFINPFRNRAAWLLVGIWVVIGLTRGWNHFQASWWLQTITCALLFVTGLIWVIDRLVAGSLAREQVFALLIVFVAAALIRVPLDLGRG